MKKVYVLILIGIGIIAGCSTGQDKSVKEHILNDLNTKYNNAKKFFGKAMVSHFPLKLDSSILHLRKTIHLTSAIWN